MDIVRWKRGSTMSLLAKAEMSDESHHPSEADEEAPKGKENPPPYIVLEKKTRTTLEWFLGLIIMLLFCACVVLSAELALIFVREGEKETSVKVVDGVLKATVAGTQICYSAECLQEASHVLKRSNFRVNPCVDFHQYACGGFEDDKSIDFTGMNVVEEKMKATQEKIRDLLEEPPKYSDPLAISKIRDFHQSCVDIASIEERDVEPLQALIEQIGGWPAVTNTAWKEIESWQELAHRLRKANLPVNFFFEPRVTFHPEHEFKLVLGLSAANHGLYAIGDESLHEDYYRRLVNAAVYFGAKRSRAELEMRHVFYFETMLKHHYWEQFSLNEMYIPMNISMLKLLEPSVNWTTYLSSFLPFRVRESDEIIVDSPQFLPRFIELLQETDVRTLTNYAITRVVWNMAPLLTTKLKSIVGISPSSSPSQRHKECSDNTINYFSVPLASYYVTQHFSRETKTMAEDIIRYLKWSFHIIFDETQWDNETINEAQAQIEQSNLFIAHPEEILNDTVVDELYSSLTINPKEYFENSRKISLYLKERGMKLIRQTPEQLENWQQNGGASLALDIMYFSRTNTTFIPAIVLEDVFQINSKAQYINFATVGVVIAKEMAKAFRLMGGTEIEVATNLGYPTNDNKWCMAKQFRNFSENLHSPRKAIGLTPLETPWEEIEDYLDHYRGLKVAYKAYNFWRETKGWVESVLPGMNFTVNQLFWVSYANMFCSKPSKESLRYYTVDRNYIKNKFRVNMAVANLPQFASDFGCAPDKFELSYTNRCEAW